MDESFVFEVAEVERIVSRIAQIAFRHDPKRADGRECSRFGSVQPVVAIAVVNQLALSPAWQVQIAREHIARVTAAVVVSLTRLLVARLQPVLVALAGINAESVIVGGIGAWPTPYDQPLLIAVMNAVIALSRVDIAWINVARHRTPLRTPHSITLEAAASIRLSEVAGASAIRDRSVSGRLGWCVLLMGRRRKYLDNQRVATSLEGIDQSAP